MINTQLTGPQKDNFKERYKEDFRFLDKGTFIVCALFTTDKPGLFRCADRLARSCEKYELPYSIYTVPEIHRSMSPSGRDDMAFTKANFLSFNLLRFPARNILYTDIDVCFMDFPDEIVKASDAGALDDGL